MPKREKVEFVPITLRTFTALSAIDFPCLRNPPAPTTMLDLARALYIMKHRSDIVDSVLAKSAEKFPCSPLRHFDRLVNRFATTVKLKDMAGIQVRLLEYLARSAESMMCKSLPSAQRLNLIALESAARSTTGKKPHWSDSARKILPFKAA